MIPRAARLPHKQNAGVAAGVEDVELVELIGIEPVTSTDRCRPTPSRERAPT